MIENQFILLDEFLRQFALFSNLIVELSNQALLARMSTPICREISGLTDIIAKCKRDRIKKPNPQIDIPIPRSEVNMDTPSQL